MARLLLALLVVAGLYLLYRWIMLQPPRMRWQILLVSLAAVLLLLVLTGRAHWLAALFAALLPFLRGLLTLAGNWPLIRRLLKGLGAGTPAGQPPLGGQTSTVQSRYIRMTLDHDSGEINGLVLEGQFAGKSLNELDLNALQQLWRECREDEESVALLQAYLDRVYEDEWHEQAESRSSGQGASGGVDMSKAEALEILGLPAGASDEEIIEAQRRLIQKLHPDRGGSEYLAAKINMAKDVLLS